MFREHISREGTTRFPTSVKIRSLILMTPTKSSFAGAGAGRKPATPPPLSASTSAYTAAASSSTSSAKPLLSLKGSNMPVLHAQVSSSLSFPPKSHHPSYIASPLGQGFKRSFSAHAKLNISAEAPRALGHCNSGASSQGFMYHHRGQEEVSIEEIYSFMKENRISQIAVAREIGVSSSSISRLFKDSDIFPHVRVKLQEWARKHIRTGAVTRSRPLYTPPAANMNMNGTLSFFPPAATPPLAVAQAEQRALKFPTSTSSPGRKVTSLLI